MSRTAHTAGKCFGKIAASLPLELFAALDFEMLRDAVIEEFDDYADDFWEGFNAALAVNPT